MNLILMVLTAGIFGTVVMDILNFIFARIGMISKVEINAIGRMVVGWTHGRFFYKHPSDFCVFVKILEATHSTKNIVTEYS